MPRRPERTDRYGQRCTFEPEPIGGPKYVDLRHRGNRGVREYPNRQERNAVTWRLTNRWSGRVEDKVPSSNGSVRAAQLNRWAL
jgi:hypothetical protein